MAFILLWPRGLGDVHWPQIWDPPKKPHHVNDAGSSPVRAEIFTGYPAAKVHIG